MNHLDKVRPTSTFESFFPQDEHQAIVADGLKRLASSVAQKIQGAGRLDHSKLVNLHGAPGRGKTHLLEAFLNSLTQGEFGSPISNRAIQLFSGENTSFNFGIYASPESKVIAVDDLLSNRGSLREIPQFELEKVRDGILKAYENRQFVIMTSNFPTAGILELIAQEDPIGRIASRIQEMTMASIELKGEDFRARIAKERAERNPDPFSL